MVDFFSSPVSEITKLALDGLSARHNAILSNISNAETSGYKRVDVKFEDQLSNIIQKNDLNEQIKEANSVDNGPGSPGLVFVSNSLIPMGVDFANTNLTNSDSNFKPEIITDDNAPINTKGNNVNIESEMVELAKNGTRYEALATLEQKKFGGMSDIIKGAT